MKIFLGNRTDAETLKPGEVRTLYSEPYDGMWFRPHGLWVSRKPLDAFLSVESVLFGDDEQLAALSPPVYAFDSPMVRIALANVEHAMRTAIRFMNRDTRSADLVAFLYDADELTGLPFNHELRTE